MPLGYQSPIEFYSPKYNTQKAKNNPDPDLRTTIYWKPDLSTSANGETNIEFYTADNPTDYTIVIEGITDDGKIVRHTDTITVK
jgi:hypothetical protein